MTVYTIGHSTHRLDDFVEILRAYNIERLVKDSADAGREYVKAYVEYIHYVEQIYATASGPAGEHAHQSDTAAAHGDQHK